MNPIRLTLLFSLLAFVLTPAQAQGYYDQLLAQAEKEAPGEVQLHIIKTSGQLSNFIAKTRTTEKVPGWPQIRVKGDAAFAIWDSYRKDYVWKGGKFEVIYEITSSQKLKLSEVTFRGSTTKANP